MGKLARRRTRRCNQSDALHAGTRAAGRAPIILLVNFGGGPTPPPAAGGARAASLRRTRDPPVAAEIIERGWGYAMVGYQDIQPDKTDTLIEGSSASTLARADSAGSGRVGHHRRLGLGRQPGRRLSRHRCVRRQATHCALRPLAAGKDGALGLRDSTTASRPSLRAARARWARRCRVATGARQSTTWRRTSRGGSPAISSNGSGRWSEMPVDAHMLIALSAPRPVFITGGTQISGPIRSGSSWPTWRQVRSTDCSGRRISASRSSGARHADHGRRSRLALSHRRTRRDAGRLVGISAIPREVFQVARFDATPVIPAGARSPDRRAPRVGQESSTPGTPLPSAWPERRQKRRRPPAPVS